MSDVLIEARSKLEAALAEINEERQRLERALSHLLDKSGGSSGKTGRSPAGAPSAAPRRKRKRQAPKGQRREEVLKAIANEPGTTAAKVAKKLDISPSQTSSVAKGLIKDKLVTKKGPAYTAMSRPKAKKSKAAA